MDELPQIGSRLTLDTTRTTGDSGERLKAAGTHVLLTVSDVTDAAPGYIKAKVDDDPDEQRFLWDDIKAGVTERLVP
jgi:hypothetical protein